MDLLTMMWKEWRDFLSQGKSGVVLRPLLLIAILGIALPLQTGSAWLDLPLLRLLLLAVHPIVLILFLVADSFAGERERHTLETLLASRLPNWAIVVGKGAVLAIIALGLAMTNLLLSSLVVNIATSGQHWHWYPWDRVLALAVLSLTIILFFLTVGILISLRCATVRQAQQLLMFGLLGLTFVSGLLFTQFQHILPPAGLNDVQILLVASSSFFVVDVVLIILVLMRFQRSHLILK